MLLECLLIPGGIISFKCMTNVMCTAGYIMSDSFDAHLVTPLQGSGCDAYLLPWDEPHGWVWDTRQGGLNAGDDIARCVHKIGRGVSGLVRRICFTTSHSGLV